MKRLIQLSLFLLSFSLQAEPLRIVSSEFVPHNGEQLPNQGYAIQLIREIFATQQQEIQIEFLPWPRALLQARQGEAVALISVWFDSERTSYLHYPTPLYTNYMKFYHSSTKPIRFTELEQLAKTPLRLGVVRGYSYPQAINTLPFEWVEVNTDLESLKMLALGRVDLVICEQMVAEYLLSTELAEYRAQLSPTGPLVEARPMYLAFSKAHPDSELMQRKFEQGLQQLKQQRRLELLQPVY
ncbi:transporter substrate-binding domain-containing protein [Rheinheimera sp. 1928-s]|uniref:substrate-binding periplasmic protein n=1 Tax=Rheinheimera sp. 1928-s TaxID=3033803 RepID=UPI002636A57F|nr:transporter substrate-binding domain-containing protein [Rheinheimera sp. 1928-s]MDF3123685.1 transporter substrate-binding domain-containing protein [Rheinheimera sp. 1928-s]